MPRNTTHVVIFGGHSIGQIQAATTQEAGERASALALDHLTDVLGSLCNEPGINHIAQRVRVLACIEEEFGEVRFDVTHAPPGAIRITEKGGKNTRPYCYVELRRQDQKATASENATGALLASAG